MKPEAFFTAGDLFGDFAVVGLAFDAGLELEVAVAFGFARGLAFGFACAFGFGFACSLFLAALGDHPPSPSSLETLTGEDDRNRPSSSSELSSLYERFAALRLWFVLLDWLELGSSDASLLGVCFLFLLDAELGSQSEPESLLPSLPRLLLLWSVQAVQRLAKRTPKARQAATWLVVLLADSRGQPYAARVRKR